MEKLLNLQDQYKFPMGQLIYEETPEATVTFTMHNRNKNMRIADYVSPQELQEYYNNLRELPFTPEQLAVLEQQTDKKYSDEYLGYLAAFRLPEIEVALDPTNSDITAQTIAPWNAASLWEIPMLSAIPELYYPKYIAAHGGTMQQVWDEGDRRLDNVIELLRSNPLVRFAEFGTRRRFNSAWQDHVVERLVDECPDSIIGTSNPWLAAKYAIPASGTNAHELPMVYAALEESNGGNPLDGQKRVIADWLERFPSMPVVLLDTFTSDVALHDLTPEQYMAIKSFRIDSGDEVKTGYRIIRELAARAIDPLTRTIFPSNSLTPQQAVQLAREFDGKINIAFGIGGNLVNNMGFGANRNLPSLNIVSKATAVNGVGTVKLSDDHGKHIGYPNDVTRYKNLVKQRLAIPQQEAA